MEQLDMLIIGGAMLTSVSVVLLGFLVFRYLLLMRQRATLKQAKSKSRKKRRRHRRDSENNKRALKSIKKLVLFVVLLGIFSSGTTGVAYYYQQTNLNPEDQESLSESTLYVAEIESILKTVEESENEEKVQANIREIAAHMSSMAFQKADFRASSDIQLILNRYYKEVGQLGINLANETVEHLKNDPELVETYQQDIERISVTEKQIYDFYELEKNSK